MRHLLLLIVLFTNAISSLLAQEPGTTFFDGRKVFIFPYRTEIYSQSSDRHQLSVYDNMDIPYYPKTLPDGEYIVYYTIQRYMEGHQAAPIKPGDTDNVAINFNIQNGMKNGVAEFYTSDYRHKKVYMTGFYKNNEKDGTWTYSQGRTKMTCHYKNDLLNGPVRRRKLKDSEWDYSYVNGRLHGEALLKNLRTGETEKMHFSHGQLDGSYSHIQYRSAFHNRFFYTYLDSKNPVFKRIEINGQFARNIRYGTWTIYTDKSTLEIRYDTTFVDMSEAHSYDYTEAGYIEEELSEDPSAIFTVHDERETNVPHEKSAQFFPFSEIPHSYTELLARGYGYFKFRANTGQVLAQDTFCNGKIKSDDSVYSFSLQPLGMLKKEPVRYAHQSYSITTLNENETTCLRYFWSDSDWVPAERVNTTFTKEYTQSSYKRSGSYYSLADDVLPITILTDSSVYLFHKSGGQYITVKYMHTPTSYAYEKNYSIYDSSQIYMDTTEFYFHPDDYTLVEVNRTHLGDLDIIDSIKYDGRYLEPMSMAGANPILVSANDRRRNVPGNGRFLPDTFTITAYWKGELLNGTMYFDLLTNPKSETVAKEIINENGFVFSNQKIIQVDYKSWDTYSYPVLSYFNSTFTFLSFKNGKVNGMVSGINHINPPKKGKHITFTDNNNSASFTNGLKDGIETHESKYYYLKRKKSLLHKNNEYQTMTSFSEYRRYANGYPEGLLVKKRNAQLMSTSELHLGYMNGETKVLDSYEQPMVICHFRNDTLHGTYTSYSQNYDVKETLHFADGLPDGMYYQYRYQPSSPSDDSSVMVNIQFCKEKKVNTAVMEFHKGFLVNESRFYHCDGIPKAIITYSADDSVMPVQFNKINDEFSYQKVLDRASLRTYTEEPNYPFYIHYSKFGNLNNLGTNENKYLFEFSTTQPGYYRLFYKSGVPSQEGRINRDGMKTGWWKYWNENGIMMTEIQYEKGTLPDPAGGVDSVHYSGKIKGYYPDGKLMMQGYVLDENFTYECVQDGNIAYQEIYYTEFYTENGQQVLNHLTGMVRDYHISGFIREEGALRDGKRSGIWKTYHSNGNLASIGAYKNGLKDGIWISGDLSGKGFVDNQCLEGVVDMSTIRGNLSEQLLNFTESIYENGVEIKTVTHAVDLSK